VVVGRIGWQIRILSGARLSSTDLSLDVHRHEAVEEPERMEMNRKRVLLVLLVVVILAAGYGTFVVRRGFSAADQPSTVEKFMAQTVRNLGIPRSARSMKNPLTITPELLQEGRDSFTNSCAGCHGKDGTQESDRIFILKRRNCVCPLRRTSPMAKSITSSGTV